jgi:hypothetical protein
MKNRRKGENCANGSKQNGRMPLGFLVVENIMKLHVQNNQNGRN